MHDKVVMIWVGGFVCRGGDRVWDGWGRGEEMGEIYEAPVSPLILRINFLQLFLGFFLDFWGFFGFYF